MDFGHRDESSFDGVMRMAFCVDGDYDRQVGVEVRQDGDHLDVPIVEQPDGPPTRPRTGPGPGRPGRLGRPRRRGVRGRLPGGSGRWRRSGRGARLPTGVLLLPVRGGRLVHPQRPPGPPPGHSGPRTAGGRVRARRSSSPARRWRPCRPRRSCSPWTALPGLPADRIPRLHAIAEAARRGELSVESADALRPDAAMAAVQELPGIGPFYSALIVVRACGLTDVLPDEPHVREATERRVRSSRRRRRVRRAGRGLATVPDLGGGDAAGARQRVPAETRPIAGG